MILFRRGIVRRRYEANVIIRRFEASMRQTWLLFRGEIQSKPEISRRVRRILSRCPIPWAGELFLLRSLFGRLRLFLFLSGGVAADRFLLRLLLNGFW